MIETAPDNFESNEGEFSRNRFRAEEEAAERAGINYYWLLGDLRSLGLEKMGLSHDMDPDEFMQKYLEYYKKDKKETIN